MRRAVAIASSALIVAACNTADPEADAHPQCVALGTAFCEATAVDCNDTRALFVRAKIPEARCETAITELASLKNTVPADLLPRAANALLQDVMKSSPVITDHDFARAKADAEAKARGEPGDPGAIQCPGTSDLRGAVPPAGTEAWCAQPDGTPHGPSATWNAAGELVRHTEYRFGQLLTVTFVVPESGAIPAALFQCPDGTTVNQEIAPPRTTRFCARKDGTRHGPALVWSGDRVVESSVYEQGRQTQVHAQPPAP